MRGVFAFPRLAWAVPVAAVVLIALFSTVRYSNWFAPTNLASVESIDGHGFNVALLREAKTKTTVIWLFENQETEDDNSVKPAASAQFFSPGAPRRRSPGRRRAAGPARPTQNRHDLRDQPSRVSGLPAREAQAAARSR